MDILQDIRPKMFWIAFEFHVVVLYVLLKSGNFLEELWVAVAIIIYLISHTVYKLLYNTCSGNLLLTSSGTQINFASSPWEFLGIGNVISYVMNNLLRISYFKLTVYAIYNI